jgi:hypothetical protein
MDHIDEPPPIDFLVSLSATPVFGWTGQASSTASFGF